MNCPVCNSEKVEENASQCPECNSDLTSFSLINEVSNQRSSSKKVIMLLTVLAVVTIGGWAYTYMEGSAEATATSEETVEPTNTNAAEMDALKKTIEAKDAEIAGLNAKLSELHATIESSAADVVVQDADGGSHTEHIVKAGESLWSISELYHGHGFKHHHIGGHNEVDDPNHIEVGDTLFIKN